MLAASFSRSPMKPERRRRDVHREDRACPEHDVSNAGFPGMQNGWGVSMRMPAPLEDTVKFRTKVIRPGA